MGKKKTLRRPLHVVLLLHFFGDDCIDCETHYFAAEGPTGGCSGRKKSDNILKATKRELVRRASAEIQIATINFEFFALVCIF